MNPLFAAPVGLPRERSQVFLAGIVGVPWQDISDEASWSDESRLRYLGKDELGLEGRWQWMLGETGIPPEDALMFETPFDRTTLADLPQTHPSDDGVRLAPAHSTDPRKNPINGHESNIRDGSRLQPACIMDLPVPRECDGSEYTCECDAEEAMYNLAQCEGTRQVGTAAYPATRQLRVLRDLADAGGNGVVGSICAKGSTSSDRALEDSFGYRPAFDALVDRMRGELQTECLTYSLLGTESDGHVPYRMLEALPDTGSGCEPCVPPRVDATFDTSNVRAELGEGSLPQCLCEVPQLEARELAACRTQPELPSNGFCYVNGGPLRSEPDDPDAFAAERAIVAHCPPDAKRMLRLPGSVPRANATLFLVYEDF